MRLNNPNIEAQFAQRRDARFLSPSTSISTIREVARLLWCQVVSDQMHLAGWSETKRVTGCKRDEDATTLQGSSGEQREEEEGEDATPARQESRRSRSSTIGHPRQPRGGNWPLRPWSPAPKRRWRASERASCRMIFRSPFVPLVSLVPSPPEIDIFTYLLSTARPIRAQAKQGILMRHAMRLQRNFDAYGTCRTSTRRVRLVITHDLTSKNKNCHCHVMRYNVTFPWMQIKRMKNFIFLSGGPRLPNGRDTSDVISYRRTNRWCYMHLILHDRYYVASPMRQIRIRKIEYRWENTRSYPFSLSRCKSRQSRSEKTWKTTSTSEVYLRNCLRLMFYRSSALPVDYTYHPRIHLFREWHTLNFLQTLKILIKSSTIAFYNV